VDNYIIEKDRFSDGKNGAIIRVVAPCSSVVKKWAKATKIVGEKVLGAVG